jgi:hypothetical protein
MKPSYRTQTTLLVGVYKNYENETAIQNSNNLVSRSGSRSVLDTSLSIAVEAWTSNRSALDTNLSVAGGTRQTITCIALSAPSAVAMSARGSRSRPVTVACEGGAPIAAAPNLHHCHCYLLAWSKGKHTRQTKVIVVDNSSPIDEPQLPATSREESDLANYLVMLASLRGSVQPQAIVEVHQ